MLLVRIEADPLDELEPRDTHFYTLQRYFQSIFASEDSFPMVRVRVEEAVFFLPILCHVANAFQGLSVAIFAKAVQSTTAAVLETLVPSMNMTVHSVMEAWAERSVLQTTKSSAHPSACNPKRKSNTQR